MSINVCNTGKQRFMNLITADYSNWSVRLFTNNHTPADGDTPSSYTEATFSGYASVTCPSFNAAIMNGQSQAEADGSATANFTCNGGGTNNNIYGYYLTETINSTNTLLWAELIPGGPISMANNGDRIGVILTLTLNHP
jgi:hypothetical protein